MHLCKNSYLNHYNQCFKWAGTHWYPALTPIKIPFESIPASPHSQSPSALISSFYHIVPLFFRAPITIQYTLATSHRETELHCWHTFVFYKSVACLRWESTSKTLAFHCLILAPARPLTVHLKHCLKSMVTLITQILWAERLHNFVWNINWGKSLYRKLNFNIFNWFI